MSNHKLHIALTWMTIFCLALGGAVGAMAESEVSDGPIVPAPSDAPALSKADFEALDPLMDLVACTVISSNADDPEAIPDGEGTLSAGFVNALFGLWQKADPSLGLTQDVVSSPDQMSAFLAKTFAAKAPTPVAVKEATELKGFIGFHPVTVNTATDANGIQIMGEIYQSDKPLKQLTDLEYKQVHWLDRGIFTFQSDSKAMGGFLLTGFSVGTELKMELALQNYFEDILVEYVNTGLGFRVQYPSLFLDESLREDEAGVSAELSDGSASFFAKRADNVNQANLKDYVETIANGITGSTAQVNDELRYGTVTYTTDDGFTVFDTYVVTDKYIYQAELSYQTSLSKEFSMYTTYLENTFMVDEVSMG